MLEKECNGNPIYLYLPTLVCISDELAPRQIQSISCNVRNRKKNFEIVLSQKQLQGCHWASTIVVLYQYWCLFSSPIEKGINRASIWLIGHQWPLKLFLSSLIWSNLKNTTLTEYSVLTNRLAMLYRGSLVQIFCELPTKMSVFWRFFLAKLCLHSFGLWQKYLRRLKRHWNLYETSKKCLFQNTTLTEYSVFTISWLFLDFFKILLWHNIQSWPKD